MAAQRLGLKVLGIELNAAAVATRDAAGYHTVHADMTTLNPDDYPSSGLIASPPCQTFSMAGKGDGREQLAAVCAAIRSHETDWEKFGPRTGLMLEPLRWILARHTAGEPYRWITMEQVPAVMPAWIAYADVLIGLGYGVACGVLNAEQFGVPQTRRRAVLVARLGEYAHLPTPTHSRYYSSDPDRLDYGVKPYVSMAQALGWGMEPRPSMTVTGGGTATGGAELFGSAARAGVERERERGRWVARGE